MHQRHQPVLFGAAKLKGLVPGAFGDTNAVLGQNAYTDLQQVFDTPEIQDVL